MKLMDALIGKKLIAAGNFTHADIEKLATEKRTEPGMMLLDGWAAQQPRANVELLATILFECGIDYSCLGVTINKEAGEVLYGLGTSSCVTVILHLKFSMFYFGYFRWSRVFREKKTPI